MFTKIWLPLTFAAVVLLAPPAVQAQGDSSLGFSIDPPDLSELFRARPPMGDCPVGQTAPSQGLPKAAHLLHLGVAGFFLDTRIRPQLSADQRARLRGLRDASRDGWTAQESELGALEVQLWQLTGAVEPPLPLIESKVAEIERLRASQRMAFIRAVLEASEVLDEAQSELLVGTRGSTER